MSEMSKEEFISRFTDFLVSLAGEIAEDGLIVRDYAAEVGELYYDDADQRELGPEECAAANFDRWEPVDHE